MSDVLEKLPINWGLLKNPLNWIIIFLMVLIAGFALHQATRLFNHGKVASDG